MRRFFRRLVTLFRGNAAETSLSREIDAHLHLLEDDFVAQGMSRDEARYAAKRAFGGVEQAKEHQRDARTFRWLAGWPMDMKLGIRMLAKSPGLAIIAVVALAVAIGGGAAYLEFVQDLLHPKLPIPGGERIVGIQVWDQQKGEAQRQALHDYALWRGGNTTLEHIGAGRRLTTNLITGDGRAEPARGVEVTASMFRMIPTRPLLGRTLTEEDARPAAPPVAVIGHGLWRARFNADPDVVGKTMHLGETAYTVVGVMPQGFAFPVNHDLWTPFKVDAAGLARGAGPEIRMFGMLREDVPAEAAGAELERQLKADLALAGVPNAQFLRADVRPYVESLLAGDGESNLQRLVLYSVNIFFIGLLGICGANVATLVFARTATREAEITVRTALGASRGRISAQLFAEALVLTCLAAGVGLLGGSIAVKWATAIFAEVASGAPLPFWWDEGLSVSTVAYAFALAVVAALLIGVIPALKATGPALQGRLREAGAGGSSLKFGGLWTGVIIGQVALTMIFLLSVFSLGYSAFSGLHAYDVTFTRQHYVTARINVEEPPPGADMKAAEAATRQRLQRAYGEIARALEADSQVVDVTYAKRLPGEGTDEFWLEFATPEVAADARLVSDVLWVRGSQVGPNYFETFEQPLVAGRYFTRGEIENAHPVAIVDETFVRLVLGGRNAIGITLREPPTDTRRTPGPWRQIVGVVKDVTLKDLKKTTDAVIFTPAQLGTAWPLHVLVHARGDAAPIIPKLRKAALEVDPTLSVTEVMTMDRLADDNARAMEFFLGGFAVVGAVALLLATAGIYSLVSFTLARRTREIGIRMALGAAPRRIITGVFARAFMQIGAGILAGAVPGLVIATIGVEDAHGTGLAAGTLATFGVAVFVIAVALIACAVPLRRALRIEPIQALRTDG